MKNQTKAVADHLRANGSISENEFRLITGSSASSSLSARVSELRKLDWIINKVGNVWFLVSTPQDTKDNVTVPRLELEMMRSKLSEWLSD